VTRVRGRGTEVKKTSKIDFSKKTFLEVFRCRDFESEVSWVTMVRGGGGRVWVLLGYSIGIHTHTLTYNTGLYSKSSI
jgi:hypothetical protein